MKTFTADIPPDHHLYTTALVWSSPRHGIKLCNGLYAGRSAHEALNLHIGKMGDAMPGILIAESAINIGDSTDHISHETHPIIL